MKSLGAIGMMVLALSLCNLMGRRHANNSNSNASGTETTSAKNSNTPTLEQAPPPPGKKPTPPPISAGVLNGKAIKLVQPTYPPIAKAAHVSGRVTVEVFIDENGDVFFAEAVSGDPLLQAAAIVAARQSKFTPTILAGKPVKVSGVVVYNFVEQ
jgi:periplasmic protein TonB